MKALKIVRSGVVQFHFENISFSEELCEHLSKGRLGATVVLD